MKKPSLAVLMGGSDAPDEGDKYEADKGGKVEAANEILDAIKANDAMALVTALCALVDLHMAEDDEEEADEEKSSAGEEMGAEA